MYVIFIYLFGQKHKNTIIYLQIFRKHAKEQAFAAMSECLFLFWSVRFCQMAIYAVGFQHPGLPVGGKYSIIQPWEPAN